MKTFLDPETGGFYQFDDDVVVTGEPGALKFTSPAGGVLPAPAGLVGADPRDIPAPQEPVPMAVSRYQGRQALRLSTIEDGRIVINDTSGPSPAKRDLLTAVEELLAAPTTPAYYREAWSDIQQFERDSPMLLAIADELGLTAANLDDLFILAATLRA